MKRITPKCAMLSVRLVALLATGCESNDQRLVEVSHEASQQQTDQNRQIAHQNHELSEATNRLIEADAESRKELVGLERDLQAERSMIGRQRDKLEDERRQIASDRHWDSAVGGAVVLIGGLLPLALCWILLRNLWNGSGDEGLGDLLTEELTSDSPNFLPLGENPSSSGGDLPRPSIES